MLTKTSKYLWWILGSSKRFIYRNYNVSAALTNYVRGTRLVGDHKNNSVAVQKDISRFTRCAGKTIIASRLSSHVLLSTALLRYASLIKFGAGLNSFLGSMVSAVSTRKYSNGLPGSHLLVGFVSCLSAFSYTNVDYPSHLESIHDNQNPEQSSYDNLLAAVAVREVGGMGAYWTCSTPEQHPEIERSDVFSNEEWKDLYAEAKALFRTTDTAFDHSIRQKLVKDTLHKANKGREFVCMPLACQRSPHNSDYVEWTATATLLGDLADPKYNGGNFELRAQHCCTRLHIDAVSRHVVGAELKNLLTNEVVLVKAKKNVICAGAVLTAGILFNSQIRPCTGYPAFVRPH